MLTFGKDGIYFFADGGENFRWRYEDVAAFETGWTLQPLVKKFDVRMRDGSKASFRLGRQLRANASYNLGRAVASARQLCPDAEGTGTHVSSRTGEMLFMFSAMEVETAPVVPLSTGLMFGDSLIPWSHVERVSTPK